MNMNTKIAIAAVIGVLVVGGGSFYAGTKFSDGGSRADFAQMEQGGQMKGGPNVPGGMQGRQGAMGGGTMGEIIAKDDTSVTVKLTGTASSTDLVIGKNVMVVGTPNSEGFPAR